MAFRHQYSELKLSLFEGGTRDTLRMLQKEDVDIAIITANDLTDEFDSHLLLREQMVVAVGQQHPLANAKSIPIANDIQKRFDDLDYLFDIGDITLNISGCINSCGHHHVGNIGILGVDKDGQEWYQVTLGGEQGLQAAIGKVIGPSFFASDMPDVISDLIQIYIELREPEESFIQTYRRVGVEPFKTRVYANKEKKDKKNTVGEDAHG